jgi:hypothetical protein
LPIGFPASTQIAARTRGGALAMGVLVWLAAGLPALAQPQGWPDRTPQREYCVRLEAQLASLDRGGGDNRGEQIRRAEDAANRQQHELDRMVAQSRRLGCERTGFFLFGGGQPPQCDQIGAQIQRMRDGLDRLLGTIEQLRGGDSDRAERRQAIMIALSQNGCGPQYQTAAPHRPRGFFDTLFGAAAPPPPSGTFGDVPTSSAFRTVCVRKCDGSFFPISYSTMPSRFSEDERACQRACPATEVELYAYRNPGEDIAQAMSVGGRPYTELANAFRYRREYNAACTCKRPGEGWAAAVREDPTVERGDIVVTDETAKAMSQPKPPPSAKPERPRRAPAKPSRREEAQPAPATAAREASPPPRPPPGTNPPRAIGPQFIPPR